MRTAARFSVALALVLGGASAADISATAGGIVAPQDGSCHGPADLPVVVLDDFGDDPVVEREYDPRGGVEKWSAPDADRLDTVGGAVVLDGDHLIVGAPGYAGAFEDIGAVYVLRRGDDRWEIEQTIRQAEPTRGGGFGGAVDLRGDTLVVGSAGATPGEVFVYRRDGDAWSEQARLTVDVPWTRNLGREVALGDGVLAVGAQQIISPNGGTAGVVHLFRRDGDRWSHEAALYADEPQHDDQFGSALAWAGDQLLVGARRYGHRLDDRGAVFRFVRDGTDWRIAQRIMSPYTSWVGNFGISIDTAGPWAVIGAWQEPDCCTFTGRAYIYKRQASGDFRFHLRLAAYDGGNYHQFGNDVAIAGSRIAVGAWRATVGSRTDAGAVYLWELRGGHWTFDRKLTAHDGGWDDFLGSALTLEQGVLVSGAPRADGGAAETGAVYIDGAIPASWYRLHGDYDVRLEVRGVPGGFTWDDVSFTIDLKLPRVSIRRSGRIVLPEDIPGGDLFYASDNDGAAGDVVLERAYWDDCLLFDGASYGDADGLLRDEVLHVGRESLCEAILRCGLEGIDEPWVRVDVEDCAGNLGSSRRVIPVFPALRRADCE